MLGGDWDLRLDKHNTSLSGAAGGMVFLTQARL